MIAVADSSFIVALEDKNDTQRSQCVALYQSSRHIYLPQSVINEVCYLLTKAGGNLVTADFLKRLPMSKFDIVPLTIEDLLRCAALLNKYADSRVDFVDASVVAVAERLKINRIYTLDRRDFGLIRPNHAEYFDISP